MKLSQIKVSHQNESLCNHEFTDDNTIALNNKQ